MTPYVLALALLVLNFYPSYGLLLRPIPTCVFKQQASSWLPHFTTFLLSTLTQLHWLLSEHASHVPQVPAPMTLSKGASPQVLAPLSPCLPWPNFGGFCMALKEFHASLSRTCEYDKSFNFICLSEDNLCGCDPSRFTPLFTAQCGKQHSWILRLSSLQPLLPIFANGTTIYLFTETKSWTIITDLFLHLSINPIYQYQSTYPYMYPNSIRFSSSLPLLSYSKPLHSLASIIGIAAASTLALVTMSLLYIATREILNHM